jgi:hypothetical protein
VENDRPQIATGKNKTQKQTVARTATPASSARPEGLPTPAPAMSDKKAAGQARKAAASETKQSAEQGRQQQLEDADWEEGAKGKNKKAEAAEAKAAAAAERKALAKAQEDEENAQLSKPTSVKAKKAAAGASKLTRAEIAANVRSSAPLPREGGCRERCCAARPTLHF